jgi:hypothetical protein
MRSSCLGSSRCGQQQVSSSIRQASSRQLRCCASLHGVHHVPQLQLTSSSSRSCRTTASSSISSSPRRQQRQALILVRSSNGSSPPATAASTTPLAAAAVATADAPSSSSSSEPAVQGQESWEEEIEETLKLVCLLPDSGEWKS